jgi:hypothetical protein
VGQGALFFRLYDANIPATAMAVGSYQIAVSTSTYDVLVTFATPTSGLIALGITGPLHIAPFTNTSTVSVLGTTHQLGTSDLLFQAYDDAAPSHNAMEVGSLTIHPTTHDVLCTFGQPMSGLLALGSGAPTYGVNFTAATTIGIPGSVHLLGTRALFFQAYDAATPRAAMGDPGVTVDPATYDVNVTFVTPTSGRFLLAPATTLTGRDFRINDGGTVGQTQVSMFSQASHLYLRAPAGRVEVTGQDFYLGDIGVYGTSQASVLSYNHGLYLTGGSGGVVEIRTPSLNSAMTFNTTAGHTVSHFFLGLGQAPGVAPVHWLELAVRDAVMPGGGSWLAPSSAVLKEEVTPFTEGLDAVLRLDPIRYRYNGLGGLEKARGEEYIGLEAEPVEGHAPYLVRPISRHLRPEDRAPTPLLAIDPSALPYMLINAVKTLQAELAAAREAHARLEAHVEALTRRLDALAPIPEGTP